MHSRNYYEIFLLLLTLGFAATWGLSNTGEVTSTFPLWTRFIWYAGLALSALIAVIGEAVFTNLFLLIERAALIFMTGLIMAYALAFIIAGIRANAFGHVVYVAAALITFAFVNLDRARQIRQYVIDLTNSYAQLPTRRGGV
jgi:hypothetical protein